MFTHCTRLAFVATVAWLLTTSVEGAPRFRRPATPPPCVADGACVPAQATWGYHQQQWRRWPGSELVDVIPSDGPPTGGFGLPGSEPPSPQTEDRAAPPKVEALEPQPRERRSSIELPPLETDVPTDPAGPAAPTAPTTTPQPPEWAIPRPHFMNEPPGGQPPTDAPAPPSPGDQRPRPGFGQHSELPSPPQQVQNAPPRLPAIFRPAGTSRYETPSPSTVPQVARQPLSTSPSRFPSSRYDSRYEAKRLPAPDNPTSPPQQVPTNEAPTTPNSTRGNSWLNFSLETDPALRPHPADDRSEEQSLGSPPQLPTAFRSIARAMLAPPTSTPQPALPQPPARSSSQATPPPAWPKQVLSPLVDSQVQAAGASSDDAAPVLPALFQPSAK